MAFRRAGEKADQAGGPSADAANLAADWRTKLPAQLDALVAAWQDPAAWEGTTEIAGMQMPAGEAGLVGVNEVLVHGWDLAVATGQTYTADPAVAQACLELIEGFAVGAPGCATRSTARSCRCRPMRR